MTLSQSEKLSKSSASARKQIDKADIPEEFVKMAEDEPGKIYVDRFEDNIRVLIMRGPATLCAYLGIPSAHPLAGNSYDNVPIRCHGGLTYSDEGTKDSGWPEGYFWFGWDYGHCDDMSFYDLKYPMSEYKLERKAWTVKEVNGEIWDAVYDLKKLMALAESAFTKGAGWRK